MSAPSVGESVDPLDSPRARRLTLRGGGLRGAAWAVSGLLSLVSLPLLVRHLGVPEFGRYVAVLSIVNIAILASDLGLTGLALREVTAATPGEEQRVLRALLGLRFAVACVGALAAIAFVLAAGYSARLVAGTAIALIGLFAQVFGDFALVVLSRGLRFGAVAFVELERAAIGTAAIVVLVAAGAGLTPFFAAWSGAAVAAGLTAVWLARSEMPLIPALGGRMLRPLLGDAVAYAAATALYVLYFRVLMLVISVGGNAHQAGLFAIGYRVIEFSAAVAAMLAATVTPLLVRRRDAGAGALAAELRRVLPAFAAAGAALALMVGLAAPLVIDVIGGEGLQGGAPVLRILAITIATTFITFGMGAALLVLRQYRSLLVVNAAAVAVSLTGGVLLVPDHGARGAALAALIGELLMVAGQAVALRRVLRGSRLKTIEDPG
jgi:O-antigen/teichoic acid export membrane protein